jgi:hypothetical protein
VAYSFLLRFVVEDVLENKGNDDVVGYRAKKTGVKK